MEGNLLKSLTDFTGAVQYAICGLLSLMTQCIPLEGESVVFFGIPCVLPVKSVLRTWVSKISLDRANTALMYQAVPEPILRLKAFEDRMSTAAGVLPVAECTHHD